VHMRTAAFCAYADSSIPCQYHLYRCTLEHYVPLLSFLGFDADDTEG